MLNQRTHSEKYPDSYYHATLNDKAGFPVAEGQIKTQVCIIGGGFSGVSTALELKERGFDVVLLEAYKIGWGASGRNGGQLIRGIGHGLDQFKSAIGSEGVKSIEDMGFECMDVVLDRIAKYDIQCDLKMGYCDLATKPRHVSSFKEELEWLSSINYGHETRLLSQDEMHQVVGSDSYIGGMIDMGSGHLQPLNLVVAEARIAEKLGAKIYEKSNVIDVQKGATCRVKTDKAVIESDFLVICGNAYVGDLDNKLGGQILPAGSYVIATEPLSDEMAQRVLPQDMAVCDQRVDLDYFRLSADKRLLFGGLCTYSGRDPRSIIDALKPNMDKVFPYLSDLKIDYAWGGMIGIGANRLPQIGRLQENVYHAQAYAGHGVAPTHMAGKLIAESISNESQRIEVFEKVSHMRFPGGRRFRSPMLAAGMLYHRFKDLF
jgi:glycine/D-amino acid oxidase-like deaminating enzyme